MPTRHIGRDHEWAAAKGLVERARAGDSQGLLITGEAGTGKTSLLRELVDDAAATGSRAVLVSSDRADAAVPYAALRVAFRPAFEREDSPALRPVVTALGDAMVTGRHGPPAGLSEVNVLELLRQLLEGWAFRSPVVFAVDDLHAADAETAAAVLYLIRQFRRQRVLVAATTRFERTELEPALADTLGRFQRDGVLEVISLGNLTADQMEVLVAARLGAQPDPSLLTALHERTAGNPFFVVQLLTALDAAGALVRADDDHIAIDPSAEPTLPRQVTTAVLHRVFSLGPDARTVASVASLFSRLPVDRLPILATLTKLDPILVDEAFDRLVEAGIIIGGDDGFEFAHPIVREALYEDLGPATRRRLHDQTAKVLAEEHSQGSRGVDILEIAGHVRRAANRRDRRAALLLADAGDSLASRGPQSAANWYREALARLPATDPTAPSIQIKLSRALRLSSQHAESARVARDALAVLSPGPQRARAVLVGAHALYACGRLDEARRMLDDALDEPSMRSSRLLLDRAQIDLWLERLDDVRQGLAAAREMGEHAEAELADSIEMHLCIASGRYQEAAALGDKLRAQLAGASPAARINLLLTLCLASSVNGDPRETVRDGARVEEAGAMSPRFRACAAWALYRLGRWDEALSNAEAAQGVVDPHIGDLALDVYLPVLLATRAERGDLAGAQEALDQRQSRDAAIFPVGSDWATGLFHTVRGEHDEAIGVLRAAAEREEANGRLNFLALALAQLAEAAYAADDLGTAHDANDRLQTLPRDEAGVAANIQCLMTQALVERDPDAAEAARALTLEYECTADAGRALGLLGAIRDDAALLRDAYNELGDIRAVYRQREVSKHLRRLGKRAPGRRRAPDQLTPAETQIVNLVAGGLTNRQVAAESRLSPKTVEVYLSRIYAKTGCRSRVELAVAVNRGELPLFSPNEAVAATDSSGLP